MRAGGRRPTRRACSSLPPSSSSSSSLPALAHSSGLRISLGFFDDVLIPPEGLPRPSAYDPGRGAWVYRPGAEEGGGPSTSGGSGGGGGETEEESDDLEMAVGAVVRFRVREVRFPKRPPPPVGGAGGGAPPGGGGGGGGGGADAGPGATAAAATADAAPASDPPPPFAPLEVIADFTDVGLGPVAWWNECEDAAAGGG